MTPITEQSLTNAGYEKQIFFFQIGGGEDEDDIYIFVKDGTAITYESTFNCWCIKPYSELNYLDGFNVDEARKVKYMEDIN
jgi:hypothetical protein